MKRSYLFTLIGSVLWMFSIGQLNAQTLFSADFEDNVIVFGPAGLAVTPKAKLTTTWVAIKGK